MRRPLVVRRRGAPLLMGAAAGGLGYMAGKSSAKRSAAEADQEERLRELEEQQYAQQQASQAYAPPAQQQQAPAQQAASQQQAQSRPDRVTQLKELAELRSAGVLTEEEFEKEKQRVLQSG